MEGETQRQLNGWENTTGSSRWENAKGSSGWGNTKEIEWMGKHKRKSNGWIDAKGQSRWGYADEMVGDVMKCVIYFIDTKLSSKGEFNFQKDDNT